MTLATSWFERGVWSRPMRRHVAWAPLAARLTTHWPVSAMDWCCPDCHRPPRLQRPGTCRRCGATLERDKRGLPAWSPWVYAGGHRGAGSATVTSCLCLDYDRGVSPEQAHEAWAAWEHVGHTSWSHTADAPRVRVVLPLATAVGVASGGGEACTADALRASASWSQVWAWAAQRDPRIDQTVNDAGRLWYLPAIRPDHPRHAWHHVGPWLDVDQLHLPEPSPEFLRDASLSARPEPSRRGAEPSRTAERDGWFGGQPPRRWNRDPDARRAFGLQLGGRPVGEGSSERIVGVTCPSCDRPSVWWPVQPHSWAGCGCSHRNSCGYTAWLDDLARVRA